MEDIRDVPVTELRPGMTVDMEETFREYGGDSDEALFEFAIVEAVQVFPEYGVDLYTSQGAYTLPESWTVPHIAYLDRE